jgi:hypothetical protein
MTNQSLSPITNTAFTTSRLCSKIALEAGFVFRSCVRRTVILLILSELLCSRRWVGIKLRKYCQFGRRIRFDV